MLDRDIAGLYGVEVKVLNQAAKRNIERFPADFRFQLTQDEWEVLRSQFATANKDISKVRYPPFAFTEHGVLMLSNVLNSKKAINMSNPKKQDGLGLPQGSNEKRSRTGI